MPEPTHLVVDAGAAFWLLEVSYCWIPQVRQVCAEEAEGLGDNCHTACHVSDADQHPTWHDHGAKFGERCHASM